PQRLPLPNVPLLGRITAETTDAQIVALLELAAACDVAAALQIELPRADAPSVRQAGERLARLLEQHPLPPGTMLVVLVEANLGKTLGNYITRWGTLNLDVIVVD